MASTDEGRRLTEAHRLAQQRIRDEFLVQFIALWVLLDSARLDETGPGWIEAVLRLVREYRRRSAEVATRYFWEFQAAEAPEPRPRPRLVDGTSRPVTPPPPAGPATGRPPRQETAPPRPRRADGSRGRRPRPDVIPEPRESRVRFEFDESVFERPGAERRTRIEFEVPELDEERLDRATRVSLTVTGPVGQKGKRARGKSVQQARDESFVEASGAAGRQVLTGGRQSLLRLVEDTPQVRGWIRVTDGDPCAFCAMLASRGPVFKEGSFSRSDPRWIGPGTAKVHDHCACTIEPVYVTDTIWPGRAAEFRRLWREHIEGRYSGKEARNEWRRLYERLQREARRQQIA